MKSFPLKPGINLIFILAALSLLGLLLYSTRLSLQQPYSELQWNFRNGLVTRAVSPVRTGDRIVSIDGLSVSAARRFPGKHIAESVLIEFQDQAGTVQSTRLILSAPPALELASRISFQFIAFAFWLLAAAILAFGYHARGYAIFILFSQLFAVIFSLGSLSAYAPIWLATFFHLAEIWIAPLAIQAHVNLLGSARPQPHFTRLATLLYTLAGILSALTLFFETGRDNPAWVRSLLLIWLVSTGILLIISLTHQLFWGQEKTASATLKLVLSGLALAFVPLVLFTLLPGLLFSQVVLPSSLSLAFLVLIPASYGYAIFRKELIPLERYINHTISLFITISLIAGVYAIIFLAARQIVLIPEQYRLVFELVVVLLLAWLAQPLFQRTSAAVGNLLYGPQYDQVTTLTLVGDALFGTRGDLLAILVILGQSLIQTMQIVYIRILLPGKVILLDAQAGQVPQPQQIETPASRQLLENLPRLPAYQFQPIGQLETLLRRNSLTLARFACENAQTWLVVARQEQPLCLIVFGRQRGGREFDQRELSTLGTLFQQAAVSIENAIMVQELETRAGMIRQLHQRLAATREQERKQISHDLHDQVIQALVALNFSFHQARRLPALQLQDLDQLQSELHQVLVETRRICADLRPPVLDTIGVVQLIRARVHELRSQASFRISLQLLGSETIIIPAESASILYSVFQEGLQNIRKHAHSSRVDIVLEIQPETLTFTLSDNGLGFELPARLELFSLNHHFGLVGLRERVESAGGTFQLETAPGQGCRLVCRLPLVGPDTDWGNTSI